jgi:hypothetical protein
MLKTRLKQRALSRSSRLTGRSAHLLPAEAAGDHRILDVRNLGNLVLVVSRKERGPA